MAYEEEQQKLKAALPEMQTYLETETDKTENLQRFIDKVKQLTEIKELTPELIHEFIDRIVVYAPKYLDGKRYQVVVIDYSGVGILRELSPEEMEEAFQKRLGKQAQAKKYRRSHKATPISHQIIFNSDTRAALGHLPYGGYPNGCFLSCCGKQIMARKRGRCPQRP